MPPIRFLASERRAHTIAVILLLGKIMPSYSRCEEKKLVYIIIAAPFSHQPSSYIECTKLNIHLSCNISLVFNTKYISKFLCDIYNPSQLLGGNTRWYAAFLALYYTH